MSNKAALNKVVSNKVVSNKVVSNKVVSNKVENKLVNNLLNKSYSYKYAAEDDNIFSNIYLLITVVIISLIFIGYGVYYYISTSSQLDLKANSSYYGKDITTYEPLFKETANTITDCVNMCTNDIICDGITYNTDTKYCTGTKNGQIRNETPSYIAWVKPPVLQPDTDINPDFTKSIILGYAKSNKTINGISIKNPYTLGFFAYSFTITIYDFYKNYGMWRHVFHKGTEINTATKLTYQSWENLSKDYPLQTIGVWLAPFTNNLRIAVTTTSLSNTNKGEYNNPFIQKCNCLTSKCYITDMPNGKWVDTSKAGDDTNPNPRITKYIEYFDSDLQNIPINKQLNITINFQGNNVEVYYDDKIVKVVKLDGIPDTKNKTSLYVMNDLTFGGEITNLIYFPKNLKLDDIRNILKIKAKTT